MIYSLFLALVLGFYPTPKTGTLTIQVKNISTNKGILSFALYNTQDDFCKEEGFVFAKNIAVNQAGQVDIQMDEIPYGTYAIAMYHDINNNGEMDKNMMGIPKEPYAFSNEVRAKWSEPTFDESKFVFDEQNRSHSIKVRFWKDH